MVSDCRLFFVVADAKPGTCGERGAKPLILRVSFGVPEARLAVIDSVSRRHMEMRDFGQERVRPLTLCPNTDAAITVVFAHEAYPNARLLVRH